MAQKNTRRNPNNIPIATLSNAVKHDPENGTFTWRERDDVDREINARFAGNQAFTTNIKGYRVACIDGTRVLAHRAMWALCYGDWPDGEVDHINGNRADNRLSNLRVVSMHQNHMNQRRKSTNSSGVNGVYQIPETGKWRARIRFNGKHIHLGVFDCITAAAITRKLADQQFGFHSTHGEEK